MFRELMPLIEHRPLSITVAALSGRRIRVNVVPQVLEKDSKINDKIGSSSKDKIAKVPESAINALTTPLSLTGTPEEIDQSLTQALTQFVESHGRLQHTLDEAREQIAEAVRAAEERDKTKTKTKSVGGTTTDKTEEKKSESGELLPLWCAPASKPPDTSLANGRLAHPGTDAEQPEG
ncbi:MAG: PRTRC system protein E [Acidobacteriia bacterium]|nr:PRTRC system protein E [Terriglobia bacterium]